MTESMKKFLEAVSRDEALTAKVGSLGKEELIALAKELGITLTEADFSEPSGELDDDELDAVTGGWKECMCAFAGGGKKDSDGKACGCVGGGYGEARSGETRCWCAVSGAGYNPDCTLSG